MQFGRAGGTRTHTRISPHETLILARLPIPPQPVMLLNYNRFNQQFVQIFALRGESTNDRHLTIFQEDSFISHNAMETPNCCRFIPVTRKRKGQLWAISPFPYKSSNKSKWWYLNPWAAWRLSPGLDSNQLPHTCYFQSI